MQILNELTPLFHKKIIAYLKEYAPEPNKSFKMDEFVKKEKATTRDLAWLNAILQRGCPYDNIPWGDQNLCEYVDAIDNIFHKKIADEIQMCLNLFEISTLPTNSKTEAIYKKLGISWEIAHDHKGNGINTYWLEPQEDAWDSLSFRLVDSVGKDLHYRQKTELLQERENRANKLYRHNLAAINLSAELLRNQRIVCSNNPVTLLPNQLPEKIWLKYIAHYLAVSSRKYPDYSDIDYNEEKLFNNAISIHKLLREKLEEILGVELNERALMLPNHRKIADKEGILDIAVVAIYPEREIPDDWSVEVTKELALQILQQLPEFNYLFGTMPNLANKQPAPNDNKQLPLKLKTSKEKTLVRAALEVWVSHLIETNICSSFIKFKTMMTNTYYKKNPKDEGEKYDDGPKVKEVYCLLNKEGKHKVYFKLENELGMTSSSSLNRALSSFKNIFDTVINSLKQSAA